MEMFRFIFFTIMVLMASASCMADKINKDSKTSTQDTKTFSKKLDNADMKVSKNEKLFLKKFNDKNTCTKIKEYLENNLFSDDGNINKLSTWKKFDWKLKGSEDTRYSGNGLYIKDQADNDSFVWIVLRHSAIRGRDYQIMHILKNDFFDDDFNYVDVDGFEKSNELDPIRGSYRLWGEDSYLGFSWIDYFKLDNVAYMLFQPNEYSDNKGYFLVSTISADKIDGSRNKNINKVINQCLFYGAKNNGV